MSVKLFERIANYCYGYMKVRVDGYCSRALTAMLKAGINYWGLSGQGESIEFYLPCSQRRAMSRALSSCGCKIEFLRVCGALHTAGRYRHRPGIVVGALIFAAILWASTYFVWDITVEGNSRMTDWQVIDSFEQYGVKFGAFIPLLDLDTVCHEYLIGSDGIAWASVNLTGTCANIVVRERDERSILWGDDTPSDLIAAEDGQIVGFTVFGGQRQVHMGDVVRRGDLLVAGTSEIKENDAVIGYRTERSFGSVKAQVMREFTESVPLSGQRKEYTGHEKVKKDYKFFTKALKSFGKGGNDGGFYDKIIDKERVILFGFLKLPVFVTTEVSKEYVMQDYTLTEAQAAELAQARMMQQLSDALAGCELVSKKTEGELRDGVYVLTCRVYCIAEIAKEVEIINYGTEDGAP